MLVALVVSGYGVGMGVRPPQRGAGVSPRAAVLDAAWRTLAEVDALSAPHGGPLSRTVKLLLDPLVIRPLAHPECAGPLVDADGAATLTQLVQKAQPRLAATAAWYTLLKHARKAAKITTGSPQDLYFQRCFALAVSHGRPDPLRGSVIARETLDELHAETADRNVGALRAYVAAPQQRARLAQALESAWSRRPAPDGSPDGFAPLVSSVLEQVPAGQGVEETLAQLISLMAGRRSGVRLWDAAASPARELGLTERQVPPSPRLGDTASTATLAFPLDRSVFERVFTVLQSPQRAELAPVAELVETEITRCCAPWALLDESLRVTALVGAQLARSLRPIDGTAASEPASAAAAVINSRWSREAYVLRARRLALSADARGLDPGNPLAAIAAELHTPWRAYARRLWVRLHGRDVRAMPVCAPDELWNLLDGVARSVILDHRDRVRRALTVTDLAPLPSESAR